MSTHCGDSVSPQCALLSLGRKPGYGLRVYKSGYEVGIVVPDHRPRSEELGLKVSLPAAGRR